MWLGRDNEENVARTRNCCGWPSSPRSWVKEILSISTNPSYMHLIQTKFTKDEFFTVEIANLFL